MILFHDTASIITLYSILTSGMLKSPAALKIASSSEDSDFIFLSPAQDNFEFNIPSQVLILDFDSVVNKYKKFFINSSNIYGPTDGTMRTDKNCDCVATFYSDELLQTEKNKLSSGDKPCLISSLKKMIDKHVLTIPQNDNAYYNSTTRRCEGGPEFGFYENNIELEGCLRAVRIKHLNDYATSVRLRETVSKALNMSVEEVYEKIVNRVKELGAKPVISEQTTTNKGGKLDKKNIKKSQKNARKNKKNKQQKTKRSRR